MFDMTQDELIALNPDLINGVEIGCFENSSKFRRN
jgi:hypothetical protein